MVLAANDNTCPDNSPNDTEIALSAEAHSTKGEKIPNVCIMFACVCVSVFGCMCCKVGFHFRMYAGPNIYFYLPEWKDLPAKQLYYICRSM